MSITHVALVGASGDLGSAILRALLAAEFNVSVLTTSPDRYKDAAGFSVIGASRGFPVEATTSALRGQDALVACFSLKTVEDHLNLAEAAAAAGVRRFVPADFGSCDSRSRQALDLVPLFGDKVRVRDRLAELSRTHEAFSWTSIVNGHFLDWGLKENFLHFDLRTRKADIVDDGSYRSSLSTLARIGDATARALRLPDRTADKMLFVQSVCVTQLDLLRALERRTGAKWDVKHVEAQAFVEEHKQAMDNGNSAAIEDLVFVLGVLDGDWTKKEEFAMDLLGLEDENLDDIVDQVIDTVEKENK